MKNKFKRAAAALMSAVMLFSQFPEYRPVEKAKAVVPDDAVNEEAVINEITLGTTEIDCTNTSNWFSFVPENSGIYEISSDSENIDAYVALYDDENNIIDNMDDLSDENSNFFMGNYLTAGNTYYYHISNNYDDGESYEVLLAKKNVTDLEIGKINYVDREGNDKRWFRFVAGKNVAYKVVADAETTTYFLPNWYDLYGGEINKTTLRTTYLDPFDEETEVLVCVDESSLEEDAENFMIAIVENNYDPDFGIEDAETHKRYSYDLSVQAGDTLNLEVQSLEGQEIVYCVWINSKGEILQKGDKDNYSTTITSVSDVCCFAFDKYFNYDSMYYQFTVDNNFSAQAKSPSIVFLKPTDDTLEFEVEATANDTSKVNYKWYYYDDDEVVAGDTAKLSVQKPFKSNYFCDVDDGYGNKADTIVFRVISDYTVLKECEPVTFTPVVSEHWFSFTPETDGLYAFHLESTGGYSQPGRTLYDSQGAVLEVDDNDYNGSIIISKYTLKGGNTYYLDFFSNDYFDCKVEVYPTVDNNLRIYPLEELDNTNWVYIAVKLNASRKLEVVAKGDDTTGLTYQWYKYENYENQIIEGETGTSITITKEVEEGEQYLCVVTDKYRNQATAYFNITLDNEFDAWIKGSDHKTSDYVTVKSGQNELTLEVEATVKKGNISYVWRSKSRGISIGNESSLTITAPFDTEYTCTVKDDYYNEVKVTFSVVNELIPIALNEIKTGEFGQGDEVYYSFTPETDGTYIFECLDKNMVFEGKMSLDGVPVEADKTIWNSFNGGITRFNDTYTLTGGKTYWYKFGRQSYGGADTEAYELTVMMKKNNNLSFATEDGTSIKAKYGTEVTFEPVVTADDKTGLSYEWTKNNSLVEGATGSTLKVTVTENASYRLMVFDKYGNHASIQYSVSVDNELKAWVKGKPEQSLKNVIPAPGTESLTFEVEYSALDNTGLTVEWMDGQFQVVGTGTSLTVQAPFSTQYTCAVSDKYYNKEFVNFYIISDVTAINVGETKTKSMAFGDTKWFAFTPENDGNYVFRIGGDSLFTRGQLFDDDSEEIDYDPDDDSSYSLKAGKTYFYMIYNGYYSEQANTITLTVLEKKENHLKAWAKGTKTEGNDGEDLVLVPYVAGNPAPKLEVEYSADDTDGITCVWREFGDTIGTGTSIEAVPQMDNELTCYISDKYGNEQYVIFFFVYVSGTISVGDQKEITVRELWEDYFEEYYYSFTPEKAGSYRIYSTGSIDSDVTIYKAAGNYYKFGTFNSDKSNTDSNFYLEFEVTEPNVPIYFRFSASEAGKFTACLEEDTEVSENHKISFTVYSKAGDKQIAVNGIEDGGSYKGFVNFTVSCPDACMVLMSDDGGATYTRIAGLVSGGNVDGYTYGITLRSDVKIVVVKVGDFTLDGSVDSADALQMLRYDVKKLTDVSEVQLIAGNVGGNDQVINSADALLVLRHDVGKADFQW
ncbi:MAG: dockerin type I repeat-containing protein [Lachnospiraceae bacterium]|nr:dockerin type I repeat-containing protein [Lachnospiraceae bacterium]